MAAVRPRLVGGAVLLALVGAGLSTTDGPASAAPTVATASGESVATAAGYRLVLKDNFKGSKLSKNWAFRGNQAASRKCSKPDPRMAKVRRGVLTLKAKRVSARTSACPYGRFLNGMIGSENRREYLYGKFEARIKFHSARGGHSAFWLQSAGAAPGAGQWDAAKQGTEVDIAEYFGDGYKSGGLTSFVYWPRQTASGGTLQKSGSWIPKKKMRKVFGSKDPSDGWHRYSVEWTPTQYIFRIDGVVTYRLKKGVSKVPEYMILSLLTSDWELPYTKKHKKFSTSMKVDWVKVWQK